MLGKEPPDLLLQGLVLRPCKGWVLGQKGLGGLLGLLEQAGVPGQVGNAHLGQAVLPLAEKVAGSPELQVLLRDAEAVGGPGEDLRSRARVLLGSGWR